MIYYFIYPYLKSHKGDRIWLVLYSIARKTKDTYERKTVVFSGNNITKSTKIMDLDLFKRLKQEVRKARHKGDIVASMFDRAAKGT